MTTARSEIVDCSVTRWYHCISKCVRSAFLMAEGEFDRKQWIENRLKYLTHSFAVSIGGFAILDNHLHLVVRLDSKDAKYWSAEEVLRRWIAVYPPATLAVDDEAVLQKWLEHQAKDERRIQELRERLGNLGWFMKALKEPLARMANKEDGCSGAFWAARFRSIAILDDEALLATSAYVDLNPVAAGIATTPEASPHTSIRQRVNHVASQDKLGCLAAAQQGSVAGSQAAGDIEQDHWLVPIEDRRVHTNAQSTSTREGMLESFSLGSYLLLVDYTGRLFRDGKARMESAVKEVFERLGIHCEYWDDRIRKMLSSKSLRGSVFGTTRERVQAFATQRGKRTANLSPQVS